MASVHKDPRDRSPFYFAHYRTPDGTHHTRSTKTANRREAEAVATSWEQTARTAKAGRLTPDKAREIVAAGVEAIFLAANTEALPSSTVRAWCGQWLESKKIEAAAGTVTRYAGILERFYAHLGKRADKDIVTITPRDVTGFRDQIATRLSRNSSNLAVKVMRACFGAAYKQGLLSSNPASMVDKLKVPTNSKRRAFTVEEIRKVLEVTGESEWRGIILTSLYTAARLGDVCRLTWRNVDLNKREVAFVVRKTGRRQIIPLARPLADYFASLPSTDNPDTPVFPKAAAVKNGATLSNAFARLLADAGFVEARPHVATGKGRNTSRPVGELTFHSLRHSAVTMLKAAGVSDALAQAIAGHESSSVSRIYTHLDTGALRGAVDKLPDVTKARAK